MKNLSYNVSSTIRLSVKGTLKYDANNSNKFSISYLDDDDNEVIEEVDKFLAEFMDNSLTITVEMRSFEDNTEEFINNN